jgi:hypothetical protein
MRILALRGRGFGRPDPQPLSYRGSLLNDTVDGGGVHNGAVHGRAVDVVESHDFEAQGFSLRLVILLRRTTWRMAHGASMPRVPYVVNELRVTNIPYAKENFRTANY